MPAPCVLAATCHGDAVGMSLLLQMEASVQELAEEDLQARLAAATAVRDEAAAGAERAATAVEAAQRELAGAEAGDGRNESNQSLQEQLEEAQNAQVRWPCCTPGLAVRRHGMRPACRLDVHEQAAELKGALTGAGLEALLLQTHCVVKSVALAESVSSGSQPWLVAVQHTGGGQAKHPAVCGLMRAMRCRSQYAAEAAAAQCQIRAICAALQWASRDEAPGNLLTLGGP